MTGYHGRYLALVEEIERRFPVARWQVGDVPVWPLARNELYLDMYWQNVGKAEAEWRASQQQRSSHRLARSAMSVATPLINAWRSRSDLRHFAFLPRPANALFLGNGVSLDRVENAWRDRFCDPLISELEGRGRSTLLMQSGDTLRLPWSRPTFAANTVDRWGRLGAVALRLAARLPRSFPDHDLVLKFLRANDAPVYRLGESELRQRAGAVAATAFGFEQVLRIVRPAMAFVVTYYAKMGHAFLLACRRRGVLSIDLQHAPQGGQHEAYTWLAVPANGYSVLPAVFWNWTAEDCAGIDAWTKPLAGSWHRSLLGGHPQFQGWFSDEDPETRAFDAKLGEIRARRPAEHEILVALQGLEGYADTWNALAALIETSSPQWRWWLRRHPASPPSEDVRLGRLLGIRRPNVLIDEASSLPLPALLRHMDAVVSLTSGTAVEAAVFGLKPIFLSEQARESFAGLLDSGRAEIVSDMPALENRLAASRRGPSARPAQPALPTVLSRLDDIATEYAALIGAA